MRKGIAVLSMFFALVIGFTYMSTSANNGSKPLNSGVQRPDFAPGEFFVAFNSGLNSDTLLQVRRAGMEVRNQFPELGVVAVKVADERALFALQNNPNVDYIEPVPMRYPMGLSTSQLVPALTNGLYGLITTKATTAHSRGVTGTGINVGVADTGLDYTHPDIAPNYKGGIDTVGTGDNDPFWNNDPAETHGTHVAGTVVAANNASGVLGVAYSANLYHARVLGPNGGSTADIMEGVRWLVETAKCKVVNLSLGGRFSSRTEEAFYNEMRSKGALVVAATGNDGSTRSISYPAKYTINIAVGAVDKNNVRASFSNGGKEIDVVAPGVGVLSSVPNNQGVEASASAGSASTLGFGLEFAGKGSVNGVVVNCGLGKVGEFPSTVAGNIALISRGDISFADKVTNAMNAGATAVIIYNNAAGDFTGTLGAATTADGRAWVPAISVSDTAGAQLVAQAGSTGNVTNQASSYDHYDGTSMATPHTTGVVTLIWSANPAQTAATVESNLFTTCTDLGAAGFDTLYGRGIVNADAAVAKAGK